MKILLIALALILVASPVLGSVVVYEGWPGIVAHVDQVYLDSNGLSWFAGAPPNDWSRDTLYDVPFPVEQIKFWGRRWLLTNNNEAWYHYGNEPGNWASAGVWPDQPAAIDDETDPRSIAPIAPNPSTGSCSISFSARSEGPISVELIDVTGRVVRRLLNGPHPAGNYRLVWDGRDDNGREVAAGVYLTRIETPEGISTGRVVLAK